MHSEIEIIQQQIQQIQENKFTRRLLPERKKQSMTLVQILIR